MPPVTLIDEYSPLIVDPPVSPSMVNVCVMEGMSAVIVKLAMLMSIVPPKAVFIFEIAEEKVPAASVPLSVEAVTVAVVVAERVLALKQEKEVISKKRAS